MKQKFWKNLFQGLSTFGAVMVFEIIGVFFLIASPPHNVLIVTILAMSGLFISFFIIGPLYVVLFNLIGLSPNLIIFALSLSRLNFFIYFTFQFKYIIYSFIYMLHLQQKRDNFNHHCLL